MLKLAPFALLFALLFSVTACGDPNGSTITVRVVSDLVAGPEVSNAEIDLFAGSDDVRLVEAHVETRLISSLPLTRGRVLATFPGVSHGTHALRVMLKSPSGQVLGNRPVIFEVTGDVTITVHVTADCAAVTCPGAGGPGLSACLRGVCVDPRCTVESPEFCPTNVFCATQQDCTTESTCSTTACREGVCIDEPIEGECGDGTYCARHEGCRPIDGGGETPADDVCGTICQPNDPCAFGYYECATETPVCTPFLTKPGCATTEDAGVDANIDIDANVSVDANVDAAEQDAGVDAEVDSSMALDAAEPDAEVDAAEPDAAEPDAEVDAAEPDAAEPVECDPGLVLVGEDCVSFEQGLVDSTVAYDDSFAGNTFDEHVALSADGNTLVVGAPHNASAGRGVGADETTVDGERFGAVYVFERDGDSWALGEVLKASNADEWDEFGRAVAISDDGSTIAVGATGESSAATGIDGDEDDNSVQSGAVYVFDRDGDTWAQTAYVKASNADISAGAEFGRFVALSANGDTLGVGAIYEASAAPGINQDERTLGGYSGAAYVFVRAGGVWTQEAHIKASNAGADDVFGFRLAFSANGNILAVSALEESSCFGGDPDDNSCSATGAAYVFVRDGDVWTEEAYLKAGFPSANDRFGKTLTLSADGHMLVIGAPFEDSLASTIDGNENDDTGTDVGAAYVFVRDGGGVWERGAYLKPSNPNGAAYFGTSVSISGDRSLVAVGARGERSSSFGINGERNTLAYGTGAVYMFEYDGAAWDEGAFVKASFEAGNVGMSVVLARDTTTLAAASNSGVLIFEPQIPWSEVP